MPKSESAKVAKLSRTTKGCIDMLLSRSSFEIEFKTACYSVCQDMKRDLFLADKTPQQSALLILSDLISFQYPIPPVEIKELEIMLEKLSRQSTRDILRDESSERKEFRIRIRKFYDNSIRRMGSMEILQRNLE